MHTYSVDSNERVKIIAMLAIISYAVTPIINKCLDWVMNLLCQIETIENFISNIELIGYDIKQLSILVVFGILYKLFDNKLWKTKIFQKEIVHIPDLSGEWEGKYISNWNEKTIGEVKLKIDQTWTKILITQYNNQSKSYSRVANILVNTNKGINIIYQYENEPNIKRTSTMVAHKGFSELFYDRENEVLDGYYTGDQRNRTASGDIIYKRIQGEQKKKL